MKRLGNSEITPCEARQALDALSRWCELFEAKELKDKVSQLIKDMRNLNEK